MYHQATLTTKAYYDTIEELPKEATVSFPDGTKKKMTSSEMYKLSNEGWYTIMASCNWGICDHWDSEPLKVWVEKKFLPILQLVDKNGKTIGYNRSEWNVVLTRNKNYHKSEVWNS